MTSFDYLPRRWALPRLLRRPHLSPRMALAVNATICSCIVIAASWAIEASRLREHLLIERGYAHRYETQMQLLAKANVYRKRVEALADLDRRVRFVASSGTITARRLAGIAGDLPQNVWLTSIAPEGSGIVVEGRAPSFNALSLALRRLSGDRAIGEPALRSAQIEDKAPPELAVRFAVHVADKTSESSYASP